MFRAVGGSLALAAWLVVGSACGGGAGTTLSRSATSTTTSPSSTSSSLVTGGVLSGSELEQLVVAPPSPFAPLADSTLKTGLMEPGNPSSGQIGIGFADEQQIVDAGFQRGWEKVFRAPDGAVIDINVFEFRSHDGPTALVSTFMSSAPKGYARFDVPGVPGASGFSGTSPEGRTADGTAFADGRFLVALAVGGPPGAHDYRNLTVTLASEQFGRLPKGT